MQEFTDAQRAVLKLVQGTIPDGPEPFAAIAEQAGVSEDEVLDLLRTMRQDGSIRRFGATLRHQKAGYGFNAMVAWRVDVSRGDERITEVGEHMARHPAISHCYYRKPHPRWPYTLYTMIHGRDRETCMATVEQLARETGVDDHAMLFSTRELKKTSMTYF
jgi:DNA-binding Lrp family transcriptional regulator